jgi:hypothetical protein
VSPRISKANFLTPTISATTRPVWIPIRISNACYPLRSFSFFLPSVKFLISIVALRVSSACIKESTGRPLEAC